MAGKSGKQVALETRFFDALLSPVLPAPAPVVAPGGGDPGKRFNIYRNNVVVGLIDCLASTYPAIAAVLGRQNFRVLAGAFARAHLPHTPVLSEYGEGFGDFIDSFAPLAGHPHLGDLARLEFNWLEAYHAADDPLFSLAALQSLSPEQQADARLAPHAALHLMASPFPVLEMFANARNAAEQPVSVSVMAQPRTPRHWFAVCRPALDVETVPLGRAEYECARALARGCRLIEAAEEGAGIEGGFDLGPALAKFVRHGFFSGLSTQRSTGRQRFL